MSAMDDAAADAAAAYILFFIRDLSPGDRMLVHEKQGQVPVSINHFPIPVITETRENVSTHYMEKRAHTKRNPTPYDGASPCQDAVSAYSKHFSSASEAVFFA